MLRRDFLLPALFGLLLATSTAPVPAGAVVQLTLTPSALPLGYSQQTVTAQDAAGPFTSATPPAVFVTDSGGAQQNVVTGVERLSPDAVSFTLKGGLGGGVYTVDVVEGATTLQGSLTVGAVSASLVTSTVAAGDRDTQQVTVEGQNTSFSGATAAELLDASGRTLATGLPVHVLGPSELQVTLPGNLQAGPDQLQISGIPTALTLSVVQPSLSLQESSYPAGYTAAPSISATLENLPGSSAPSVSLAPSGGGAAQAASGVTLSGTSLAFLLPPGLAAGSYDVVVARAGALVSAPFIIGPAPTLALSPSSLLSGYGPTTVAVGGEDDLFSASTTVSVASAAGTVESKYVSAPSFGSASGSFVLEPGLGQGTYSVTVRAPGFPALTGTITVGGAELEISGPASVAAGQAATFTVESLQSGAPTPVAAALPVQLNLLEGSGTLSPQSGSIAIAAGSLQQSFTLTSSLAQTVIVQANAANYGAATASVSFAAGAASRLAIAGLPRALGDGATAPFTVGVEDGEGNAVTPSAAVSLGFSPSGGYITTSTGTSPITTYALTQTSASFVFHPTAVGSAGVSVSAQGLGTATATMAVAAGSPAALALSAQTASPAVGAADAITIRLQDAAGHSASAPSNLSVALSATLGAFYGTSAMASEITAALIPAGASQTTVYYASPSAGSASVLAEASGIASAQASFLFAAASGSSSASGTSGLPPVVSVPSAGATDVTSAATETSSGGGSVLTVDPSLLAGMVPPSASDLTFEATTQAAQLNLPQGAIPAAASDPVTLATTGGSFTIPVDQVLAPPVLQQLGAASSADVALSIALAPSGVPAFHGLTVLGAPLSVQVTATASGKEISLDQFASPVTEVLKLPTAADPGTATGALLVDGTPEHARTQFSGTDATIVAFEPGTYAVVSQQLQFKDIRGLPQAQAIESLADKLVTSGTRPGAYDPSGGVTRAEFAALVVRALGLWGVGQDVSFKDLPGSYWARPVIDAASAEQLIEGYPDGTFRPGAEITNDQMAAIAARAMAFLGIARGVATVEPRDQAAIPAWARSDVALVLSRGIMGTSATGDFAPSAVTTRAEAAQIVWNLMQAAGIQ